MSDDKLSQDIHGQSDYNRDQKKSRPVRHRDQDEVYDPENSLEQEMKLRAEKLLETVKTRLTEVLDGGTSQAEIARRSGLTRSLISQFLSKDKGKRPEFKTVVNMALALEIPPMDVLKAIIDDAEVVAALGEAWEENPQLLRSIAKVILDKDKRKAKKLESEAKFLSD